MRRIFAIKGSHNPKEIIEIFGKSYLVTDTATMKLKDNFHSNTFMFGDDPILKILDTEAIDYTEIYDNMTPASFESIDLYNYVGIPLMNFKEHEYLFFVNKYFLYINSEHIVRIKSSDCIKILQYLQTFGTNMNFEEEFKLPSKSAKGWAKLILKDGNSNTSIILFFILLVKMIDCLDLFYIEWKNINMDLLFDIEYNALNIIKFINESYLNEKSKLKLTNFMKKLFKKEDLI